jgi:diguanylate cyclase (GGDEF)-like protein
VPSDIILSLIVIAIVTNLAVMVALIRAPMTRRRGSSSGASRDVAAEWSLAAAAVVGDEAGGSTEDGVPRHAYDRIVRIVSWVFLLASATIVAASGLWPQDAPVILLLLGVAGVFVLIVHDVLPDRALGPIVFALEGSLAITLATLLVALTGGDTSPFFFAFPLIVGGAALVVSPPITVAFATIATIGYLIAVVLGSGDGAAVLTQPTVAALVAVNVTAMLLLAYVSMVIAREQRRSRDAAIRLSTIDPLTGLFNRGFFFAALEREIARSARSGRGFCLLMMDLDDLKAINDQLGHFHGDRVLRAVGGVIAAGVRRIDTAARYGGDEFVVLLPETDPTGAFILAEKIRIGVREMALDLPDRMPGPSISAGVVMYPIDGSTVDGLMINADSAMYRSKRAGKNRVSGVSMAPPVERPPVARVPTAR